MLSGAHARTAKVQLAQSDLIRSYSALGDHVASRRIVGDGLRQAVFVQYAHLPPEEQGGHRHDDEDLEEYPDVDAGEYAVERVDVRMRTSKTDRLVDDGRGEEEQRHVARKLAPTLVRVMERLAEHEAE